VIRTVVAVSLGFAVGPAFAGDAVMWGEEAPNGAVRVQLGAPGREPVLVHRVRPATARKTERGFSGFPSVFAASPERFAAIVHTSTVTFEDSDSISTSSTNAAISGRFGGGAEVLSGAISRRGDEGCKGRTLYEHPEVVDVDGHRVAIGQFAYECDRDDATWEATVVVVAGGARTTIAAGTQASIRDVALAGRYVAWLRDDAEDELVVHDLEAGAAVLRVTQDDVAARGFDELALQEDGTVAFLVSNRSFRRVMWASPATPGVRQLAGGFEFRDLALAGGRALYERVVHPRRFTGELLLRPLTGEPPRRLAFFPERRRRVGDLDLTATRATWAEQPTERGYEPRATGPARIFVRDL
jgi:hypothetical protein